MGNYKIPTLPLNIELETKAVLKKLTLARAALAELNWITKLIPNPEILINSLALQEAKDSSAIENIVTTHDELYKADMKIWNISLRAKEVQDYRQALILWYKNVKEHDCLFINDIRRIQENIEHNDLWIRKIEWTVLMNDATWNVVYTPPQNHDEIVKYMSNLESYINERDEIDPLIKMAIIHHQFESIHPFHDWNGRTWRIINVLYLVLEKLLDLPILYLSWYIITHKAKYYELLQAVRDENKWEDRILFVIDWVEKTALATTNTIKSIWNIMWETKKIMKSNLNFYSKDFLELLFKHPYTKIDFVVIELWVVRQTASKYLQELENLWIVKMIQIQKEKYYVNIKLYDLLKKWF